ncbi:zinc-binding dehydrogenase [Saccharothrix variisporea]|uniref:Zinc-binding dehydrogenase n=1 Tax=Saccharothrix variisporea TaxID=543527 RepID=A0A495XL48_9PSEU|nr:zinc-binding dehydrogenase [Saccharothrix variisporea]RKT73604.1 zinc-binding dehydrogenase [Saccharothrix variisporea]
MQVVTADGRRALSFDGVRFPVPAGISDEAALVLGAHGVTAWHLLRTCAHLEPGETVVVHDAAGPVGVLAVQLAVSFGAGRVVATARTQAQRRVALRLGADVAVTADPDGLTERLVEHGPVDVVLDAQGGEVFERSLAALAPFGRIVCYGEPPAVDPVRLLGGSRAVVGFRLDDCADRPGMVASALSELMGLTAAGRLRPCESSR